ncbi:MAG: PEP-CTERM sorting domain-containing protein [Bryobacteraceae bacterium]
MFLRVTALLAVLGSAPAAIAGVYQVDDGTVSATGLGRGYFGALASVWLNGFQAQAGMETITTVSIMFGAAPIGDGLPANGSPVTVVLYTDPNNDGNPIDGVLQRQVAGAVQSADTGTFVDFAIPSLTLATGSWFYVGMAANGTGSDSIFGANLDSEDITDPTDGGPTFHLGWFSGTPDIANLSGAAVSTQDAIQADFMIRATGLADTEVPEPATWTLLALGGALASRMRRR